MNFRPILLFSITYAFLISVFACGDVEHPKEVSLNKRDQQPVPSIEKQDGRNLKFGFDLRLGPKEDVRTYLPFLKYLQKRVGSEFCLEFTERYDDTIRNLGTGVTHFAALGPVSAAIARDRYNVRLLVMGLNQHNKPEYRGVIFTRKDSPINDLKSLKGKTFAFGNKLSTQGHVIPRKMLEDAGVMLEDLEGFIFSSSHANTASAVLRGDYDAGGIQDGLANRLLAEGKIKILAISEPYPSSLICYNDKVDPEIISAVKKALLTFNPNGEHASSLVDWDKTEMPNGFTQVEESSLDNVVELVRKYGLLK